MPIKRIVCVGAGYVGGPTCAVIALKCPEIQVTVVDQDSMRIEEWNSDKLPIYENQLDEIVRECRGKNLFFKTMVRAEDDQDIQKADMIFISVNTPTKINGAGRGKAPDLQFVEAVARHISRTATSHTIVVEKSTVPVKAAESIARILSSTNRTGVTFEVLSNPEFLAEGTAIQNLLSPDRVVIGGELGTLSGRDAIRELRDVYAHWVHPDKILTMNTWSAELTKLVNNAFLAMKLASIFMVSELCEATGADVEEVKKAVGMDSRIGPEFLNASLGFGGSCFHKDVMSLTHLCEVYKLPVARDYFQQIVTANDHQRHRFADKIVARLFNNLNGKKIAVFGFAFKKNTGDTRESSSIVVCKTLLEERARLSIYDPQVRPERIVMDLSKPLSGHDLPNHPNSSGVYHPSFASVSASEIQDNVEICQDPYQAAAGAHAVVVCTEWDEFKELDYQAIYNSMEKPAHVFDGRIILDHDALQRIGFKVFCIGKSLPKESLFNGYHQNGHHQKHLSEINGHAHDDLDNNTIRNPPDNGLSRNYASGDQ